MSAVRKQTQKSTKSGTQVKKTTRPTRAQSGTRRPARSAAKKKKTPADIERDFMRPSARMDRRIIEGMLEDRDGLMAELTQNGVTEAMVLRRAAECGVSESLLRQVKGVAADLAGDRPGRGNLPNAMRPRNCLSCERVFLSLGAANRLCIRCRGGDAGLSAMC